MPESFFRYFPLKRVAPGGETPSGALLTELINYQLSIGRSDSAPIAPIGARDSRSVFSHVYFKRSARG